MELTWDEEKRRSNLAKHGLDFADAEGVFRGAVFIFEDKRHGEQRFVALGMLSEIVVVVAFTEPEEDLIRIISMRKAIRNEQQIYFEQLAD
jgi:uncharacterized DUF497 family protein